MKSFMKNRKFRLSIALPLSIFFPIISFYFMGLSLIRSVVYSLVLNAQYFAVMFFGDRFFSWKTSAVLTIISAAIFFIVTFSILIRSSSKGDLSGVIEQKRRYIVPVILSVVLAFFCEFYRSNLTIYSTFKMPSESMLPTLLSGDLVEVNMKAYSSDRKPSRGEVVVYSAPFEKETRYIKRVIGLPGDRVKFFENQIFINDVVQPHATSERKRAEVGTVELMQTSHEVEETLGGVKHLILLSDFRASQNSNWPSDGSSYQVPENTFFVVGDNRNDSTDSRVYGAVPYEDMIGRVEGVLFSVSPETRKFRLDRILLPF